MNRTPKESNKVVSFQKTGGRRAAKQDAPAAEKSANDMISKTAEDSKATGVSPQKEANIIVTEKVEQKAADKKKSVDMPLEETKKKDAKPKRGRPKKKVAAKVVEKNEKTEKAEKNIETDKSKNSPAETAVSVTEEKKAKATKPKRGRPKKKVAANTDAPKPVVKTEVPKAEVPKPEAPKPVVKTEVPKAEVPKAVVKIEETKAEAPKAEASKPVLKIEETKPEAPKAVVRIEETKPEVKKPVVRIEETKPKTSTSLAIQAKEETAIVLARVLEPKKEEAPKAEAQEPVVKIEETKPKTSIATVIQERKNSQLQKADEEHKERPQATLETEVQLPAIKKEGDKSSEAKPEQAKPEIDANVQESALITEEVPPKTSIATIIQERKKTQMQKADQEKQELPTTDANEVTESVAVEAQAVAQKPSNSKNRRNKQNKKQAQKAAQAKPQMKEATEAKTPGENEPDLEIVAPEPKSHNSNTRRARPNRKQTNSFDGIKVEVFELPQEEVETTVPMPVPIPVPVSGKKQQNKKNQAKQPNKTPQNKIDKPIVLSQLQSKDAAIEIRLWEGNKRESTSTSPPTRNAANAFMSKLTVNELPKNLRLTPAQKSNPAIAKVLTAVDKFLTKELYIDNTVNILTAVSGGVDSVTLLDALSILSGKYYYTLQAAHYNHTLRGEESFKDEELVKALLNNYNVECFTARGDVKSYAEKNKVSIELAARTLRYSFLERTCRTNNSDFVATAHTADDSAETFLMNLIRGTGLTGLSGIPSKRNFVKNVALVRPFISLSKKDIIDYANARNLKWREDKSNTSLDHTRNIVRHSLIPLIEKEFNPNAIEAINRAAKLINGAEENITMQVEATVPTILCDVRTERFSIKSNVLMTFDEFMRGELLQHAISKHLRLQSLSMQKIDAIMGLVGKTSGKEIEFAPGLKAIFDRNLLIIGKIDNAVLESMPVVFNDFIDIDKFKLLFTTLDKKQVKFNSNPKIEFFDAEKVPEDLIIRPWEQGDYFSPLGMEGTMKVSDFLINEKISAIDKPNILVVAEKDSEEIIWVCGYRINEKFKITDKTRKAIRAEYYTL